jgi:hypothetical protein
MERRWAGDSLATVGGGVPRTRGAFRAPGTSVQHRRRADVHGRMVRSGWATRAAYLVGVAMGHLTDRSPGSRRKWV